MYIRIFNVYRKKFDAIGLLQGEIESSATEIIINSSDMVLIKN